MSTWDDVGRNYTTSRQNVCGRGGSVKATNTAASVEAAVSESSAVREAAAAAATVGMRDTLLRDVALT